jgi:hypothetical protein
MADSIDFNSKISNVLVGQTFQVDIVGNNFNYILDGGGFDLSFNPSIVLVDSLVVDTTTWDFKTSNGTLNPQTGTITNVYFNDFFNQNSGNFPIAIITLTALHEGSTPLTLSSAINFPFGSGGTQTFPTLNTGTVNVSGVPLPASVWLFGLSVFAWLLGARKGGNHV